MKTVARIGSFVLTGGILTLGAAALLQPVQAVRPQPDCGPTFSWNCVRPGCPDCYEVLFEGTVCEKAAFEKQTGLVCSPA